jgi:uncharacterized membrane protein
MTSKLTVKRRNVKSNSEDMHSEKTYYKLMKLGAIFLCVGFAAAFTVFISWYVLKNPILALIGWIVGAASIVAGFIVGIISFVHIVRNVIWRDIKIYLARRKTLL